MKAKPRQRPPAREIAREVERIRGANVPLGTQWYVAAGELGKRLGINPGVVLEMFAEMAHVYAYGQERDEAERRAWHDTEQILVEQSRRRVA